MILEMAVLKVHVCWGEKCHNLVRLGHPQITVLSGTQLVLSAYGPTTPGDNTSSPKVERMAVRRGKLRLRQQWLPKSQRGG